MSRRSAIVRQECGGGITEVNVSLLKGGHVKGARFETLASICEALDCQPRDLLEYRREPEA